MNFYVAVEPATWRPPAFYGGDSRLYNSDKVVHDPIRNCFVKNPFIAKRL